MRYTNWLLVLVTVAAASGTVKGEEFDLKATVGGPNGEDLYIADVNDQGHACGFIDQNGFEQAVFLNGREVIVIETPSEQNENAYLSESSATSSRAVALNEHDQVVYYIKGENGLRQTYIWEDGESTKLPTLGGKETVGKDINLFGCVVGASRNADGVFLAFAYYEGQIHNLGTFHPEHPAFTSEATAVNDRFQVVGRSQSTLPQVVHDEPYRAFFYEDGEMKMLRTEKVAILSATDINNHGDVTGKAYYALTTEAGETVVGDFAYMFAHDADAATRLTPAHEYHRDYGMHINDHGWVIGVGNTDLQLWRPGKPAVKVNSLRPEPAVFNQPASQGMNDRGDIVGALRVSEERVIGVIIGPKEGDQLDEGVVIEDPPNDPFGSTGEDTPEEQNDIDLDSLFDM
ncbi:MAG: hypothetical protein WDZ82_03745 [Candidatus Paceibacterota bacterium]